MKNLVAGLALLIVAIIAGAYLYNNWGQILKYRPYKSPPSLLEKKSSALPAIRISGLAPGGHFLGSSPGFIRITNFGSELVNVTGWRVEANRGSFNIPKAIEVYDPSGSNSETDIVLLPGDTLSIFTNPSANRRNFMINRCMGYLENSNFFEPPLPRICPRLDRSELIQLPGICQSYLLSLGACQPPEPNTLLENDPACAQKMAELNYRGCFEKHGTDKDFLTGEWRVWGSGAILDPLHDIVKIVNKEGLIIGDYIY